LISADTVAASASLRSSISEPHPIGTGFTTLRDLVDSLGAPLLHVLAAPRGLSIPVRTTVFHDPVDNVPDEPDAVLVLAGIRADDPTAIDIVEAAADFGYNAVILKRRGAEISALVTAASLRGVAVLAAADEVSWRHIDSLLQSVFGAQGLGGESVSGAGDELFALANSMAAVIGGSVAIEDLDRQVLAYSSVLDQRIDALREQSILERRVPDLARHPAQYATVLKHNDVVHFASFGDELARSAIAIKAGEQPLGTIWAIEGAGETSDGAQSDPRREGLSDGGVRALQEGARFAALRILRTRNAGGPDLQLRETALLRALDGSLTASEASFRLSLPSATEITLIGFATPQTSNTPLITHVASALSRYTTAYRSDASMATTARAIYVLLPSGGPDAASRFVAGALAATTKNFGQQVRGAVSFTASNPTELPAMRQEIDDILRVLIYDSKLAPHARLEDVHTRVLLAHVSDELGRETRLAHPGVVAMRAYDVAYQTCYCDSITAWLDEVGDVAVAAKKLGIHTNTLRYRLRRAGELFAISLSHPDDRLAVWMQLRLVG
jgi:PucR C-terminal helix-turn-helix domain